MAGEEYSAKNVDMKLMNIKIHRPWFLKKHVIKHNTGAQTEKPKAPGRGTWDGGARGRSKKKLKPPEKWRQNWQQHTGELDTAETQ